ncbi:unnamed protein product [Cuscuta europaea]|uniref:feruloyl-CoA 6-hydroxylase n=1 Tax=Cuscuta europaea TaxID=41803 RepID=A0A9P0YYY2_CUSEU|nr:unnamed protein product [Cuscuta europaea]
MAEQSSAGSDDPPFMEKYKNLFQRHGLTNQTRHEAAEELELPLIDLAELNSRDSAVRKECQRRIARASREWGFFQVVNHGIPPEVLENMRSEQVGLFSKAFVERERNMKVHFPDGNYQWGTPTATNLWQFSWSESFHVPLTDISNSSSAAAQTNLRSTMGKFAARSRELAQKLAAILVEELGDKRGNYFQEKCPISTCYVRMNRYPPCPNHVFGLTPHTDSDFLTILHQDQIGGLHLVKDNRWISVKPKPTALVINIGDLFQVLLHDFPYPTYPSRQEHRLRAIRTSPRTYVLNRPARPNCKTYVGTLALGAGRTQEASSWGRTSPPPS